MNEQVEERLKYFVSGDRGPSNEDVMHEVLETLNLENGKPVKRKKDKKSKKAKSESEEDLPKKKKKSEHKKKKSKIVEEDELDFYFHQPNLFLFS